MTRQDMIDVLCETEEMGTEPQGPLGMRFWEFIEEWIAKADPESIEVLLDLLQNPTDSSTTEGESYQLWYHWIDDYLEEWVMQRPEVAVPRIGPLLVDESVRPVLLRALYMSGVIDVGGSHVKWLKPLLDQLDDLSRDEVRYLTVQLGRANLTPETQAMIERIRDHFPSDDVEMRKVVEHALNQQDHKW